MFLHSLAVVQNFCCDFHFVDQRATADFLVHKNGENESLFMPYLHLCQCDSVYLHCMLSGV